MSLVGKHFDLDARGMDVLIQETLSGCSWGGRAKISLAEVRFIDPYGCAVLLSLARHVSESGHHLVVELPASEQVCSYMARIGLTQHLSQMADLQGMRFRPVKAYASTDVLLELSAIRQEEDVITLSQGLNRILRTNLSWEPHRVATLCAMVAELCQNIPQHSGSTGVACIQAYGKGLRRVKLGVSDIGIGVLASLKPVLASDCDDGGAIMSAMQLGVSRLAQTGRGLGLARVHDAVVSAGGRLNIRSGKSRVFVGGGGTLSFFVAPLVGTHIGIELPD